MTRKRWFFDTEFAEDGRVIDLISIALVCEDGREYYAVSKEFDPLRCNDWVRANVLPLLPPLEFGAWKTRLEIATDIRELVLEGGDRPEFWAYFADYDWVVLCQLYGRMVDLPKGFPFWCRDLKQRMADAGVSKEQLPLQSGAEHSALEDARRVRTASLWLDEQAESSRAVLAAASSLVSLWEVMGIARLLEPGGNVAQRQDNGQAWALIEAERARLAQKAKP